MKPEKYAELFASEAREHLDQISQALITLEAAPEDAGPVHAVFRSVHTIKGMAAAMGYEAATQLSHTIETALEAVRSGRRAVDSGLVDVLLAASDALELVVEGAVAGEEVPAPSGLIAQLEEIASGSANSKSKKRRAGRTKKRDVESESAKGGRPRGAVGTARVRVDIRRLDALMNLLGELIIAQRQMEAIASGLGSEQLNDAVDRAARLISDLQAEVIESRMVPVWQVFDRFPRVVRDVARALGKEAELEITGKELELDRSMLDAIGDPLVHVLRNAVGHGIESPAERKKAGKPAVGRIKLAARRERSRVVIEIEDDGRGIDRAAVIKRARETGVLFADVEPTDGELFRIVARPGFTTADEVTEVSGRGVGLNVVEDFARAFGGTVELRSQPGEGTAIRLELPLTIAILRAVMVQVSGQVYALPVTFTRASFELPAAEVERAHGGEWVTYGNQRLPLTRLREVFETNGGGANGTIVRFVTVEYGGERRALEVDALIGDEEIVVKEFDAPAGALPVFSGATVRADGRPALIVDVAALS